MEQENLDFDGHVVVFTDEATISKDPDIHCVLGGYPIIEKGLRSSNKSVLRLLYWQKTRDKLLGQDAPLPLLAHCEGVIDKISQNLRRRYGKEVVDIIMEGRLKMSLLIDTDGGTAMFANHLIGAIQTVLSKRGDVEAYVPRKACSAGSLIFAASQKRYVSPYALFMWHLGSLSDETDNDYASSDERRICLEMEMEEMDEFFRTTATGSTIMARYKEVKDDTGNPLNEVWFTGEELYEDDIATEMLSSTVSFAKRYNDNCLAEIDREAGITFFSTIAVALDFESKAGRPLNIDVSKLRDSF